MYATAILTLPVLELILMIIGAIVLGMTIHFFITSRRSLKNSPVEIQKLTKTLDEWKRKYFNDIEERDKQVEELNRRFFEAQENSKIYKMETEELKRQIVKLRNDAEAQKLSISATAPGDYLAQLSQAQSSLLEHNEKINRLLEQIDMVRQTEEKQQQILRDNERLSDQLEELQAIIREKEQELAHFHQKQTITKEMSSMLDNAYTEFNVLQSKLEKLESQLASSRMVSIEYEDLKEAYYKMTREFDETKVRLNTLSAENQQMQARLKETEDKLKESNFQRQQLQKKITYLEELNNDLQHMSEANKKLESQIRRIGELESMLNIISEERDELRRRKENS